MHLVVAKVAVQGALEEAERLEGEANIPGKA